MNFGRANVKTLSITSEILNCAGAPRATKIVPRGLKIGGIRRRSLRGDYLRQLLRAREIT
jgi:hypothetical protein